MSYQYSQDPEENLPDWLKELRKRQQEAQRASDEVQDPYGPAKPESEAVEQPPEEAQPEVGASEPEPELPDASELSPAEPDWLLEIRRRHEQDAGPVAPRDKPVIPAEDLPPEEHPVEGISSSESSLTDTQPLPPAPAAKKAAPADLPAPEPEEAAMDAEQEEELSLNEESEAPFESSGDDQEDEIAEPDWLTLGADEDEIPVMEPQQPEDAAAFEESPAESDSSPEEPDLPDWLMQDDFEEDLGHTPAFTEEENDLTPGELPSWLAALRPPGGTAPIETSSSSGLLPAHEESVGPLAGLRGVLPAEPEVVMGGTPRMPTGRLDITEGQQRHAATLDRLIAEEGRPKEDYGKQIALPSRILNLVIAGVLVLATLIPLFTGNQTASLPQEDIYPLAAPLFNQIEVLPSDAPVLVAFDVEPGLYGEVKLPAGVVLGHLLEQQARLVFISTQATGPALAERLLHEELGTNPDVATGNYINLGYLSGGMAALRAFALDPRATTEIPGLPTNPWNSVTLQSIGSLNDFGMVLVISSETEDSRAWIEQTADSLQDGLYMVTSAQAAPLMRPYSGSHPQTLRGLVAGLAGAAHYAALQGHPSAVRPAWDAYSYAVGAAALMILLGGLYNRLIHLRPHPDEEASDA